ncbi:S8 family serine peptidase [Gallaecimonas xiamenensis]|uniref:Peptidase S8/S53 subtilisin kexin sedolisin n=1 Tax=Gallaecimonas xiamenensis 3-C-1 TaxID=745411 RepID=K2KJQ6_9GAMM|nr:S8 family serine peptidase [Gallaecimonas xiamenensis]EKE77550.1 peptidase S8/S53 subtilisin kexin sedolisin [Gallaecimonas xiamenensis 3-C-1]
MKPNSLFKISPLALALFALPSLAEVTKAEQGLFFDKLTYQSQSVDKSKLPVLKQVATNRYIVELKGKPVAVYEGGISGLQSAKRDESGKILFGAQATRAYVSALETEQKATVAAIKKQFPAVTVKAQFDTVFNGLVVEGLDLDEASLRALPNVKNVYRDQLVHVQMDASLPIIKAPLAWNELGGRDSAGKGIRIAVVDSGIRPENPMFSDAGMEAPEAGSLPTDDYCHTTDPDFCNNKLIVARAYPASSSTSPDEYVGIPKGYNGHGTHVAGTAAGVPVSAEYGGAQYEISGVAPSAYLMAYKALYYNGNTASGLTSSLISAVNDAVKDGADVINNSWGGGPGGDPNFSAYKSVFENAEAAGVVVVTAAGNDGNAAKTVGCPGCVESGITVANTQTGRGFSQFAEVENLGQLPMVEGSSPVSLADLDTEALSAPLLAATSIDQANVEGCTSFPVDSFAGGYALISRGTCSFSEKADNASAAGALGIVVYNNNAGEGPFIMSMPGATVPGVMISKENGDAIESALANGNLTITLDPTWQAYTDSDLVDVMNASSSRGPNGDSSFIKPDMAAPGTNILSAASPDLDEGAFGVKTGTSMASPHVAGAAALVLAAHPDWTPAQVKAALTTTSNTHVLDDDGVTPANAFAKGAGRLETYKAIHAGLSVSPVSIAGNYCFDSCSFQVATTSLGEGDVTWVGSVQFDDSTVTGTLAVAGSETSELVFGADNKDGSFTLSVDTSQATKDKWYFGTITWQDSGYKYPQAHMPVAIYAGSSSDLTLLSSSGGVITANDSLAARTQVNNQSIDGEATLKVSFPEALSLQGTPVAVVKHGSQASLGYDEASRALTWTGTLDKPSLTVSSGPAWLDSLPSLTEGFAPETIACGSASQCDEGEVTLNAAGLGLSFVGQEVTKLTLGTNGYVALNGATVLQSYFNDAFPTTKATGAVLAPFWTDLDMSSVGQWYYSVLSDGIDNYLTFEWKDVPIYGDDSIKYTFQVLFKLNSSDVYFHYVKADALPANLSVGAQLPSGADGDNWYFDGTGTAPTSASTLTVANAIGSVELSYEVTSAAIKAPAVSASTGANWPVAVKLPTTIGSTNQVIESEITGGDVAAKSQAVVVVNPVGEKVTATLASAPNNGSVSLDNGVATYTPNTGFIGADSFGYTLTDEAGNVSFEGTVTVQVEQTNAVDKSFGGGGALGFLALLLAPLAWLRRRHA